MTDPLPEYTPLVWKDTDNSQNPATVSDPFLDAGELNSKEQLFKKIVDAIIALQTSSLGYTDARAVTAVSSALVQGSGINITLGSGTITISTTLTQYTDTMAQAAAANIIQNGTSSGITWFYDSSNHKLNATVSYPVTSVAGRTGAVVLSPSDIGLDQVNNTSDATKPVSTAQQTALNAKQNVYGTTSPQTASVQAQSNQIVVIDTTGLSSAPTITSPADGSAFGVRWKTGGTYAPIIATPSGSGYTIRGSASITMGLAGELVIYQRFGSDYDSISGEKSAAALSAKYASTNSPTFTGTNPVLPGNASANLQAVPYQQLSYGAPALTSYLTSDTSVTSSTTLINSGLIIQLTSGWWAFDGFFYYTSVYAAGIKLTIPGTANISGYFTMNGPFVTGQPAGTGVGRINYIDTGVLPFGTTALAAGDPSFGPSCNFRGTAYVGSTDYLIVQFAQSTSTASATSVKTGSWMRAQRLV